MDSFVNSYGSGESVPGDIRFLAISTDIRFAKIILNRLEQVCKPSLG